MVTTYDSSHTYDGKEFSAVLRAMSPGRLRRLMKTAYREETKAVRAIVRDKAAASGLRHGASVGRSVRARVFSGGSGFMVTANPRGNRGSASNGFHKTRTGQWKPIALWANAGVDKERKVRIRGFRPVNFGNRMSKDFKMVGEGRGRLPAFHFVEDAERPAVTTVERDMGRALREAVLKQLSRQGIVTS